MKRQRLIAWICIVWSAACVTTARSEASPSAACSRLREASAEVQDVAAGVSLSLTVTGSELDVVTLQDYVSHVVNAWNEAELGVARRCFPRVRSDAGVELLSSTAELVLLTDGARVVFKPVDPAQLGTLREHVRRRRARTLSCACEEPLVPPRRGTKRTLSGGAQRTAHDAQTSLSAAKNVREGERFARLRA